MAVYKDTNSSHNSPKWRVACYYTDWKGEHKKHDKRGFTSKKEALEYERAFLAKASKDIHMSFDSFIDVYMDDVKPKLKKSTVANKAQLIESLGDIVYSYPSVAERTSPEAGCRRQGLLRDISSDDQQPADGNLQSRCPVLRSSEEPLQVF